MIDRTGVCPICGFWTENLADHLDDELGETDPLEEEVYGMRE